MFNDSLCFLKGSKVAQLAIAWLITWGRWSLWIEATETAAVSGAGVAQEGALAVDANLWSGLSKAQGKLWS